MIALQRANGSWDLTPDLARRLGLSDDVPPATPTGISDAAWATLLALAWLEKYADDEREEWLRLSRKAETWLAVTVPAPALDDARAAAREVMK